MGKFQYHSGASLRESAIEAYLLEHIDSIIESAQVNLYMDAGNASPKPARSAQSVQEELNRLNTMYQKGRLSEEYYDREYERLTALLSASDDRQLEEKRKRLKCVERQFSGDWKVLYKRLDNSHKRAFWKQTIEEILVDPDTRKIKDVKLLI